MYKNKGVIRATVRLKGTCNLFFDDPEDARDYVETLAESVKEKMIVESLKIYVTQKYIQ
jgi:hypothetical protein